MLLVILILSIGISIYQIKKINQLQYKLEILDHRIGETYLNTKFNNRILKKHAENEQEKDHHINDKDTIIFEN